MAADAGTASILVWFEDTKPGYSALIEAGALARDRHARLTVLTVATHERVIGCGRCLQGTVLWNQEMKKMAQEDLELALHLLDRERDADYRLVVGDPADAIIETAIDVSADTVVIPRLPNRVIDPPNRRRVGQRVARGGDWQVIEARQAIAA